MTDQDRILSFITKHGASSVSAICLGTNVRSGDDNDRLKRRITEMEEKGILGVYRHGRQYVYFINAARKWFRCKW